MAKAEERIKPSFDNQFSIEKGVHIFKVNRSNIIAFAESVLMRSSAETMLKLYVFNLQVRMASGPFEKYAASDFNNKDIKNYLLDKSSSKDDPKRTLLVAEVVENVMSGQTVEVDLKHFKIAASAMDKDYASGDMKPC